MAEAFTIIYEDENHKLEVYSVLDNSKWFCNGCFNTELFYKEFPGCHLKSVFNNKDSIIRDNTSVSIIQRNFRIWRPNIFTKPFDPLDENNGADPIVLRFINDFYNCHSVYTEEDDEKLRRTFMCGYCFYFAHMLKKAFGSGEVCWCAPYAHFVWCNDYNGNEFAYDIEGVSSIEADYYIPEHYLGELINDFKHVSGKDVDATEEEIDAVINQYLADIFEKERYE